MQGYRRTVLVVWLVMVTVLVDATKNGTAEDEGETFEMVEKRWKASVGSMVKRILPTLMNGASESDISGPCQASIMRILGSIRQLREWAVRFIDATGKIPSGILEGTSISIGDYDECLDIQVGRRDDPPKTPSEVVFRGQYCLVEFHKPEGIEKAVNEYVEGNKDSPIAKTKTFLNMFIRYKHLRNSTFKMGVCVPSVCTKGDIQSIFNSESFSSLGKLEVSYCETKSGIKINEGQIFLLCFFGIFIALMISGTIIDALMRITGEEENEKSSLKKRYVFQFCRYTSLYSNALDVLSTTKKHEPIRSLCGIRTLVVIVSIYSHTYGHIHVMHFQKFSKAANFIRFFESFTFSGIANGSVSMDTVVFIAGLTITYTRWRYASEKNKVKLGVISLILQRYFRMAFAQVLTICLFLLLPLYGSGPIWQKYMGPMIDNCKERWWLNMLFIGNFWKTTDVCLYHTWILAVIMQLTLVSVIILFILRRSSRFGIFLLIGLILGGIIGVGVMTVIHQLPGSMAFFMLDARTGVITWRDVYILAYDHLGPFCIGLFTGYYLGTKKDTLTINKVTSAIFWCLAISCNCAVMFGLYSYRHGEPMELSLSTFYAVMHRNVWAVGIAWIVIACATRHGGPVARVLHSRIFLPLDRLCYMAYLIHIPLMYYHSGSLRERWFMGHMDLTFMGIGYIVSSFVSAFVLHIIFVKPYYALEEHVCAFFHTKYKLKFDTRTDMGIASTSIQNSRNAKSGDSMSGAYNKSNDEL